MWYIYLFFSIPFIGTSLFFWYIDMNTTLISKRYDNSDRERLKKIYKKIIPLVSFNLFIIHPMLTYYTSYFVKVRETFTGEEIIVSMLHKNYNIPLIIIEFITSILSILWIGFVYEVIFYVIHRLLHNKLLINLIHYKHHELKTSVGIGGIYTHPCEYLISNFFPGFLGLYSLGSLNIYTICILSVISGGGAAVTHSGYSGTHIRHHWAGRGYYGIYGIMDYLFNTQGKHT